VTAPPQDLMAWPKKALAREVTRLRAVLYEHSEAPGEEPVVDGGTMVDPVGDPYARGNVLLDVRKAVLMDSIDVSLVDTKREGEPPRLAMLLAGRINFSQGRARQLYLFDEDGAAAIVSELVALATRIGPEFADRLMTRLEAMP
jgi:hypothetical protein